MKKIFAICYLIFAICAIGAADAYQVHSSKELGRGDARNQNIVVNCTTPTGQVSNETCTLRRYARCVGTGTNKNCSGWLPWRSLQNPAKEFGDWRTGAATCCQSKGLR